MKITDTWDEKHGRTISIDGELIKEVQSKYQNIKVYDTKSFGKLLQLDGVIQLTEFDEANYHEMLTHVPLLCHEKPDDVLVIGGGDGGVIREIIKHKRVKKIDFVEIDKEVVKIARDYFPNISSGLSDPRVNQFFTDGAEYIKNSAGSYDVIIIDSTDPFSVGESLFKEDFYENLSKAIKPHGIIVSQSESLFYNEKLIEDMHNFKTKYFDSVKYYYTMVPTYPSGMIGFQICSDGFYPPHYPNENSSHNTLGFNDLGNLKYYNYGVHLGSFLLPNGGKKWRT